MSAVLDLGATVKCPNDVKVINPSTRPAAVIGSRIDGASIWGGRIRLLDSRPTVNAADGPIDFYDAVKLIKGACRGNDELLSLVAGRNGSIPKCCRIISHAIALGAVRLYVNGVRSPVWHGATTGHVGYIHRPIGCRRRRGDGDRGAARLRGVGAARRHHVVRAGRPRCGVEARAAHGAA